jgi:glucosamine--fructose-6-phosphate aminotransferase (isomerizing)
VYGARPDLRDCLVVGVSQSGESPDLTEVIRVAREQGALTLAVTNAPGSPLTEAAQSATGPRGRTRTRGGGHQDVHAELLALLLAGGGGAGATATTSAARWRSCRTWPGRRSRIPTATGVGRAVTGSPGSW